MKAKYGTRLCAANLHKEYVDLEPAVSHKNLGGKALLQKNYGKDLDCTITSLSFVFGAEYYPTIEKYAKEVGYNGDKSGTCPLFIKNIMRKTMRTAGVSGVAKSAYIKNVGFSWSTIVKNIDNGKYTLLNLYYDGRNYYKDHTVTIIGYLAYSNNKFLIVYDNWNPTASYIDYDKLSSISSINWYE